MRAGRTREVDIPIRLKVQKKRREFCLFTRSRLFAMQGWRTAGDGRRSGSVSGTGKRRVGVASVRRGDGAVDPAAEIPVRAGHEGIVRGRKRGERDGDGERPDRQRDRRCHRRKPAARGRDCRRARQRRAQLAHRFVDVLPERTGRRRDGGPGAASRRIFSASFQAGTLNIAGVSSLPMPDSLHLSFPDPGRSGPSIPRRRRPASAGSGFCSSRRPPGRLVGTPWEEAA